MRNIAFKILLKFKTSKLIKLMVHKLNLKEIVWFGFFFFSYGYLFELAVRNLANNSSLLVA